MSLELGVIDGHQHISANFITHLFRASTRGAVQRHNWALDAVYDLISYVSY
jgi:3-dehydrosphinganine reductase